MPASKAQQKAVNKYMKENYDRFLATFRPKGRLDEIKAHAVAFGESTNAFIGRAIQETMKRDTEGPQEVTGTEVVSIPPQAPEAPQDGALVLMERGQVSTASGTIRTLYTASETGREYYVEPVISDSEWDDLQRAKGTSPGDPDELPF